jgi:hypothetical protein
MQSLQSLFNKQECLTTMILSELQHLLPYLGCPSVFILRHLHHFKDLKIDITLLSLVHLTAEVLLQLQIMSP